MFKPKDFLKDNLPGDFVAFLSPQKKFLPELKKIFLAEFDNGIGRRYCRARSFNLAAKVAVSLILFFGLAGGLVAYADSANVDPNHPLYVLKRYGESMRLVLAGKADKPVLRARFAERRLKDVKSIEKSGGPTESSARIKSLRKEMRENFSESLDDAADSAAINKSCAALGGFIGDDSPHVDMMFGRHPELFQKFQEKCSNILENNQDI